MDALKGASDSEVREQDLSLLLFLQAQAYFDLSQLGIHYSTPLRLCQMFSRLNMPTQKITSHLDGLCWLCTLETEGPLRGPSTPTMDH